MLLSDDMKNLCNKILLIKSVILSGTKLNKSCKANKVDTHKACKVLIDHGLLSLEYKILANKSKYNEAYLKKIPRSQAEMLDFTLMLSKFEIRNIDSYFETLKTSKLFLILADIY